MKKNNGEKKEKKPPEQFWQKLVDVYFQFYKSHFRDNDGYALSPDWSGAKVGMEAKGLKEIIVRLRTIAEEKNIEWSEGYAVDQLNGFLEKAYNDKFFRKSFLCCVMNKFKTQIIVSENNSVLINKILEAWYYGFPNYSVDRDLDREAAEVIITFLKSQFKNANINFTDEAAVQSFEQIVNYIKTDEFWMDKSLKSISRNLQEFVNKIKANKNGRRSNPKADGIEYAISQALGGNK